MSNYNRNPQIAGGYVHVAKLGTPRRLGRYDHPNSQVTSQIVQWDLLNPIVSKYWIIVFLEIDLISLFFGQSHIVLLMKVRLFFCKPRQWLNFMFDDSACFAPIIGYDPTFTHIYMLSPPGPPPRPTLQDFQVQVLEFVENQNDKTQLSATTPPLGVCNFVFCFFCFFGFLVSCFLVRCWFFEGLRT